ncbi:MAG: autotransporter outer membrane beta-barrel domain-containing protein [Hyphomonadaceae bacterium]|nr:autotransporter outer membrane beta-barrel domain-containing protein [Hyphomonadaceae bacterium]
MTPTQTNTREKTASRRDPLGALTAFTGVASLLIAAPTAQAQQVFLTTDDQAVTLTQNASGDPGVAVAAERTRITVPNGITVSGTGNYREFPPTFNYFYTAGQGAIGLFDTGGTVTIQAGAAVTGLNYGITTPDGFTSNALPAGNITIVNNGSVIGENNDGIRIANHGTVINTGTIIGARSVVEPTDALFNNSLGDGISHFTNGTQSLASYPADGIAFRVTNSGSIDGRRMGVIASGGSIVTNSGTIHGDSSGVLQQNTTIFGGPGVILIPFQRTALVNSGSITARFQNGANVQSVAAEGAVFSVDIDTLDPENLTYFADYDPADADSSLINTGLIETFATAGEITTSVVVDPVTGAQIPVQGQSEFFAISMESPNGYIFNGDTGVIRALNGANGARLNAIDVVEEIGGVITLENQGSIIGSVVGSDGQELILNNGLIDGDVALGLGDDLFVLDADGVVTGAIDLGDGDDTMIWNTAATVGDIVTGGTGDNKLVLFLAGGDFDATRVFNFGSVETLGSGDLGDLDLSLLPEIEVNDGVSLNIGSTGFTGVAFINPGGELVGVGEVEAIVIRGAASVSPGNSIGTINVTGNVDFSSATTYNVEVSPLGSDQIVADGAVTLAGGAVAVTGEDGVDLAAGAAPASYVILSGGAGVTGTFATLTENLRFYDPSLAYTPTQVLLVMNRVGADFQSVALTPNQIAIGDVLYDALLPASGDFLQVMRTSFPGLSAAGVRQGLDTLSGPIHGWAPVAASEVALQVSRGVADSPTVDDGGYAFWVNGLYGTLEADASATAVGAESTTQGATFGATLGLSNTLNVSAFAGYAIADADDDAGGSLDGDSYFFGAQVRFQPLDGVDLGVQAGYLNQNTDVSRRIAIGALRRNASATYNIKGRFIAGDAAWMRSAGPRVRYGVFGEAVLGLYESDGFTEAGAGSVSLVGAGPNFRRITARAGLRVAGDVGWVRPHLEAGVQLDGDDRRARASLRLAGLADQFTVVGPQLQETSPFVSAGASFALSENITGTLRYDGAFGDDARSQAAMAKLAISF